MKKMIVAVMFSCLVSGVFALQVNAADWTPVTGTDTLTKFMSGLKAERNLAGGKKATAEYNADGTGVLHSWGANISRTWKIIDNTVIITARGEALSYQVERNSEKSDLYRVRDIATGVVTEFTVTESSAVVRNAAKATAAGGAAAPTMDEIAAELANPNTSLATINLRNQFRWFDGDLPHAGDQFGYTALLQPILPFPIKDGSKMIFRPAFPFIIEQPVYNEEKKDFDSEDGFGDIVFDLFYAAPPKGSFLTGYGVVATLPTASSDLGLKRYAMGPEVLLGYMASKHVGVLLPSHQWHVGGSGDADINMTSLQMVYVYLPGGGYNVGTTSLLAYDWESSQWTIPLNLTLGKTVTAMGRPWKLALEVNYYVEKADAFGAEWMVGFNLGPVVKNVLADMF